MKHPRKKIFVSYSSRDSKFVEQLVKDLQRNQIEVWEYGNGIKVGESIPSRIELELGRADHYVIILSPNSVASTWVQRELNSAIQIENNRGDTSFIVPVLKKKCDRPLLIAAKRYADFAKSYQLGLEELLYAFGVDNARHNVPRRSSLTIRQKTKAKEFEERISIYLTTDVPNLLDAQIPNLLQSLAETLSESLVNNVIEPNIVKWRQGEIATLNDMAFQVQASSFTWSESREVKELFSSGMRQWLTHIREAINNNIDAICSEFGVPLHRIDRIGESILNAEIKPRNIGDLEFTTDAYSAEIAMTVGSWVMASILTLLVEILVLNILATIIAILVGITVFNYGVEKSEKFVKQWNIPKAMRKPILPDKKLKEMCRYAKSEFSTKLFTQLDSNEFKSNLAGSLRDSISNSIKQEIDDLILLIP